MQQEIEEVYDAVNKLNFPITNIQFRIQQLNNDYFISSTYLNGQPNFINEAIY